MRSARWTFLSFAVAPAIALTLASGAGGASPVEETTPSGIVMVRLQGGAFEMGAANGDEDARPARRVSVSAFLIDKYEVTQEAFLDALPINPSKVAGPRNPVEQVRWFQAAKYCNARSRKEGLRPCYDERTWRCDLSAPGYRLPTEAEWEYACRAGTIGAYPFGDDPGALPAHAWVKANSGGAPHPVGERGANPWGLCDMLGNVMEWCNDFYAPDAYRLGPDIDPPGPAEGKQRVLRGGGWRSEARACASGARAKADPATADICLGYPDCGFRCVRRVESR